MTFPFLVALWYVMLKNVGKVIEKNKHLNQTGGASLFSGTHSNREIRINCQSAFTGLSFGKPKFVKRLKQIRICEITFIYFRFVIPGFCIGWNCDLHVCT